MCGGAARLAKPPGNLRTSQHCVLCFPQEQWAGTTWHFSCLCTSTVSWDGQASPDCTWNSCYPSDNCQNCTAWEALELCSCCKTPELDHTDCGQDGNLFMTKSIISWPYKQQYGVRPFELSWTTAACAQHLPLSGTPLRVHTLLRSWSLEDHQRPATGPGLNSSGPSLLEAQPLPIEKYWGVQNEYFAQLKGNF